MVLSYLSSFQVSGHIAPSSRKGRGLPFLLEEALQDLSCCIRRRAPYTSPPISALISLGRHCQGQVCVSHWTVSLGHCWLPSTRPPESRGSGEAVISGPQEEGTLLTSVLWRRCGVPSAELGSQVPTPPPLTMAVSPSSTISKLHVSVAPSKSGVKGGTLSRRLSHSRPKKKGCFRKSPAPFRPRRTSGGHSSCWMRSRASSGTPVSASGRQRCSCSEGAGKRGCYPGAFAERSRAPRAALTL